eukprot:3392691-Prymnesium_polylepis.1
MSGAHSPVFESTYACILNLCHARRSVQASLNLAGTRGLRLRGWGARAIFFCSVVQQHLAGGAAGAHRLRKGFLGLLVQVGHGDTRSQLAVVGVLRRQEGGRLRGEIVQLLGGDAVVHAANNLLRDDHRVDVLGVEAVAQLLDPRGNLVEGHVLAAPIAFDNQHLGRDAVTYGGRVGGVGGRLQQQAVACTLQESRARTGSAKAWREKSLTSCASVCATWREAGVETWSVKVIAALADGRCCRQR